jgi:hypothetical protein
MKDMMDRITVVLLPVYVVASSALVWGLDRLSAQIVSIDSAWQALEAEGGSTVHIFAEGINSIPFFFPGWILLSLVIVTTYTVDRRKKQNKVLDATSL